MGEEDLLGQWKSALEQSQHRAEVRNSGFPPHQFLILILAATSLSCPWALNLSYLVLSSACVWDTMKWNWVCMTGQPQCTSHLPQISVFACMDLMHQSLILPGLLLCCASVWGWAPGSVKHTCRGQGHLHWARLLRVPSSLTCFPWFICSYFISVFSEVCALDQWAGNMEASSFTLV